MNDRTIQRTISPIDGSTYIERALAQQSQVDRAVKLAVATNLIKQSQIDYVAFTGSVGNGAMVEKAASRKHDEFR
jgi:acyl-CoA reductase-like NAD-dependent aldehyde dehydrogenase